MNVFFFVLNLNKVFHIKGIYIYSTRENNSWNDKNDPIQKFTYTWFLILCCYLNDLLPVWILPLNDWDDRTPEKRRWQPLRGPQRKPTISDYTDLTNVCHKWRISTWRQPLQPLQPWPSAESRTHRWAPETDLQWGPRHLDIHRGKTPGTSGPLTLWLCCSWNKLLIRLAGGELAPRLSLVSPKVFSPFCHRWSFGSLPLSPLACSVGDTSFPAQSSAWLHRYYLNWTKLDNAITKLNNEMHSAHNWVLNPVILHYWHNLPILILCSALLQFVLLKALYK